MLCIYNQNTEPYFNIALEEYFLKNFQEDIFILWNSTPSIIVGKHQNTTGEVNLLYAETNKIPVIRRISGGGTVYHDEGNLNFTFIKNGQEGKLIDFKKYTTPIIIALQKLNLNVTTGKRNDLLLEDKKISGNAEHIFKNRALHHGTLLFNSNLDNLNTAILPTTGKITDKSVKSNRSTVTNILEHLQKKISFEEFKKHIFQEVIAEKECYLYFLEESDKIQIQHLVEIKYKTAEWNFAYSPPYTFEKTATNESGWITIILNVEKNIITNINFESSNNYKSYLDFLKNNLLLLKHNKTELTLQLNKFAETNNFPTQLLELLKNAII